jgi:hypothetical protein
MPARKPIGADPFFHNIDFLPLPASGDAGSSTSGNFQVDGDSDFRLHKLSLFADLALAAQTEATRVLPGVTITIKDSKTGRAMMINPIPLVAIFGDGRLPFILPRQKVFPATAVVTVNVVNLMATAYNLRLVFSGEKLFYE